MDSVVEWIIGHVGIIMVLAITAVSLMGKMKINIGSLTGERPIRPMPSFGGGPGEVRAQEAPKSTNRDWSWESGEGVTMEGQETDFKADQAPVPPVRSVRSQTAGSGLPAPSGAPAQAAAAGQSSSNLDLIPDKEDLTRAVLWAEILGPPRAKRPYGRRQF